MFEVIEILIVVALAAGILAVARRIGRGRRT